MSVFNPQVPGSQDPNYLGYAKVIDAPSPDQSTGLALSTAAQGLEGFVKVTDASIKVGAENEAYKRIDPERNKFTSGLETIKSNLQTSAIPAPVQTAAGTTTGNILDANASMDMPEVPDGIDQGIERIAQLKSAQKAAAINDTEFSSKVLSIATQMRAQYPGYRDYVDEQVSKISGMPVANSYYKNLMQDINRQLVQQSSQKDIVQGLYLKNLDVPYIQQNYTKLKAGDPSMTEDKFISTIADWQNLQSQQKIDAASRAQKWDNKKAQVDDQTERLTDVVTKEVNLHVNGIQGLAGVGTVKSLTDYINDAAAGRIKATDTEVDQRKTQLAGLRNVIYQAVMKTAQPYSVSIGPQKAKEVVDYAMQPIDATLTLANSKDSSPAFFQMRQVQAINEGAKYDFLLNKDTSAASRAVIGARAVWGESYMPQWIRNMFENGIDQKYRGLFEQENLNVVAPLEDKRGQPIPRYMKDAIVHGKKSGAPGEYIGGIVGMVTTLADPKAPLAGKDKVIEWAYNEKNIGRLDELKMDYRDPNTGEMVPGKYRAFNILSSPGVVQGVAETAKVHPENYTKLQGTLEVEFGSLFRSDVAKLSQLTDKPYLNAHFSWDETNGKLGLVDRNNRPIVPNYRALGIEQPNQVYLNGALEVLDRVNGGLKNLINVQKSNPAGPGDITSYAFNILKDARFRPGAEVTGAENAMKAIFKSRNPETTPQQLDEMLLKVRPKMPLVQPLDNAPDRSVVPPISRFAPEKDSSLKGFLSNPTGGVEPQQSRGVIKGNLSDSTLMDIKTDDIPEGMSARDFIKQLQRK